MGMNLVVLPQALSPSPPPSPHTRTSTHRFQGGEAAWGSGGVELARPTSRNL